SKVSLMPDGLTDTLTRAELVDLVAFLAALGKGERWSVGKAKLARRWQAAQPDRALYQVLAGKGMIAVAGNEPGLSWQPGYSAVAGALPVGELAEFRTGGKTGPRFSLVRTQLSVTAAAKARLKVNGAKGLTAWLDGEPLTLAATTALELKPGLHTLTVAVR